MCSWLLVIILLGDRGSIVLPGYCSAQDCVESAQVFRDNEPNGFNREMYCLSPQSGSKPIRVFKRGSGL